MPRAPKKCGRTDCTTRTVGHTYCPKHRTTWPQSKGRNVPHRLQTACFRRDQYTCQRCGHHGNPGDGTLHADHTRNRAAGGPNHLDNLETLCTECHKPKTQREAKAGKGL
ncbi:HNH endonuclease [Gordonia westfalica]|uniref:5-methylcytosine-specific restriction enzyme A n=1 Tax=Gordonia westfalica TaxID=158898 RepID=A0A1H2DQI9_9ACTN|nr:5-methylcytosine-specific restriction enzyme A [Gordonia westfalica]SDT89623.1 5-methylcytosine-specific restriction enzyme A [Gordonia westfalica]